MSKLLTDLIERRARLWEKTKAHLDATDAAEFDGQAQETWVGMNGELIELDARIDEIGAAEQRTKRLADMRVESGSGDLPDGQHKTGPSAADKFRALARGEIKSVDFKAPGAYQSALKRWHGERRDVLISGTAGAIVPDSFLGRLYEHMIDSSAIRQTNVTVLTTAGGEDLQVPKTTAYSAATIIAEGAPITESDPAFAQVVLGAFKYAILVQVSSEALTDNGIEDLEGFLARQGGQALANGSGAHFMTGTGAAQPLGVVTASTLGVTGAAAVVGAFTADNLIDLAYSVIEPYAGRATWMMRRATEGAARKLKGSDNNYLWQPGLVAGTPNTLLGRPVVSDPNIAAVALSAKSVIFGDMSTYYIRDVSGVRVERSDEFAFSTDLVTFRFILRTDGDLIDTTGSVKHFIGNAA